METDKKLEMLEGELKLLKGEVKESLSSVRDYLQRAKLPTNETVLIPATDNEQSSRQDPIIVNAGSAGGGTPPQAVAAAPAAAPAVAPAAAPAAAVPAFGGGMAPPVFIPLQAPAAPADAGPPRTARVSEPEAEAPEMEAPAPAPRVTAPRAMPREEYEDFYYEETEEDDGMYAGSEDTLPDCGPVMRVPEAGPPTPQVNLLANLIRWVASTRKQIGPEQLPTFLEVYGITGNLSPELKEVILQLVEITSGQEDAGSTADVWSRLILELHGILAGGGAPFHGGKGLPKTPEKPAAELEAEPAVETKPEMPPLKLKIVYPGGDGGTEKEVTIDLNQEAAEPEKAEKKPRSSRPRKGQVAK